MAGTDLPTTFGAKVSWGWPAILVSFVASLLVTIIALWVVKGKLDDRIDAQAKALRETDERLTQDLSGAKTRVATLEKDLKDTAKTIREEIVAKVGDAKKELTESLNKVAEGVDAKVAAVKKEVKDEVAKDTEKRLAEVKDDQNKTNTQVKGELAQQNQRLKYVEDKIQNNLTKIEKEVDQLKDTTGDLKKQYVELKGEVNRVREKGDITEKDVLDLTEKSRVFQLRVMAARAQQAAEAAREADLKKLLDLLTTEK